MREDVFTYLLTFNRNQIFSLTLIKERLLPKPNHGLDCNVYAHH